jgi:hypothetical protein
MCVPKNVEERWITSSPCSRIELFVAGICVVSLGHTMLLFEDVVLVVGDQRIRLT